MSAKKLLDTRTGQINITELYKFADIAKDREIDLTYLILKVLLRLVREHETAKHGPICPICDNTMGVHLSSSGKVICSICDRP